MPTVIGAGGIGTRLIPLIKHLCNLTVMDGDTYERANLDRQLIPYRAIGKNKAVAMAELHKVNAIPDFLVKSDQLKDADWVICVPDNHKCRLIALEAADLYFFPLVLAGNQSETANAMYYHAKYKGTSVDPRIKYPDMLDEVIEESANSCLANLREVPQTALANNVAANMAAALFMYWSTVDLPDELLDKHAPFEHIWRYTTYETKKGATT